MIALENTPYYTTCRNLLADKQNKNDEVTLIFRRITESSNSASLALVDHLIEENKRLEAELAKRPVVWCATDKYGTKRLFETLELAKKCGVPVTIEPYTGEQE